MKKHLKHYAKKRKNKNPQIRAEKAPNTTLQKKCEEIKNAKIRAKKVQKLYEEKKIHKFVPEKHLILPYKHYAKKIKKKRLTNSSQKST